MPISVKATFAQDGVFFAGEKLNCTITFTNSSPSSAVLISGINGTNSGASTPTRQPSSLQQKLQLHHDQQLQQQQQQQEQERNGHGNNNNNNSQRNLAASSNTQSRHASSQQQQPSGASLTSPSLTPSALASPTGSPPNPSSNNNNRPTAPLAQNAAAHANSGSAAPDTNLSTQPRSDAPQKRPGTTVSRAQSQTRLSSDISHIDVSFQQELNGKNHQQQGSSGDHDQEEQEEQEKTIAVPALSDDEGAAHSPVSPTPRQVQQIEQQQHQDGGLASISSPGLLGLASFVYRSASFSSLANAFGLSGSEPEQHEHQRPYDEKKLPPLPPPELGGAGTRTSMPVLPPLEVKSPELEEEKTTKESLHDALADQPPAERRADPNQLSRYGTPIGLGLDSNGSGHVRTGTNGSMSGLSERMIELQVTDNADTQSMADDSEYQTPRPSMDAYSTRSSMQSVRGPFQHQYFQDRPTRRSSLMSNYSTLSSPRGLPGQGSKKEALLWGSVQVVGQFMVDGSFIRQQGFESLKSKTMYRPTGSAGGGAIGGGTLGTVTSSDWRDRANANRLFPVFSTPPSILFVDLNLAPGESCSYTYQIELPSDLPPSHRGKTIRFAYNLVLGVQRGSVHTPAKSVQLPFRLYNNISELGTRPVYDMMSPVIWHKDTAISHLVGQGRQTEKPAINPKLARKQFEDYVEELLQSIKPASDESSTLNTRELTRRESDAYKDEDTIHAQTCLEKVALLSRSSSSASYDICKNNVPVAKLSLIKTRFKLGETVHGVISFSSREIPTYQISVTLETVEAIEPNFACRSAAQTAKLTKRVHAELHESCIDTMRTSFSLCIPPTATPEFKTSTLTLKWYLRVEFITGPANQPRFKMTSVDERRSQYHAVESLSNESFDCSVPIQVYPTSYETGALFPPTMSFNLA
ncbi:Rgp1-domain-containing protein [Linnemannia elongata AG-77]|uniref:Rgp1-domain-containing protein n=1 Tax=Linnemannia elongata AG-77 TaxID=1314771 RepID=A0A197JEC1_9FUNG|nr:Rgp1-domain-containing protein [Linnemannia elongata AG-77]